MTAEAHSPRILTESITPMVVEPVTLEGEYIRLEPLSMEHHAGLCEVALDEDLWRWSPSPVRTPDAMHRYIELALKRRDEGSVLPFATIYKPANRVVGSTRFLSIERTHHRVEIGSTFIGKTWQRTVVNTEAKYLMLCHAFETLGCLRVEFQTDSLNLRSQMAIQRLGAKQEGIFRNHKICADGRVRHSIFFSITDEEWPSVRKNLEVRLEQPFTLKA